MRGEYRCASAKMSVGPAWRVGRGLREGPAPKSGPSPRSSCEYRQSGTFFLCVILVTWFPFVFIHCFESHFFGAEVSDPLREVRCSPSGALCLPDGIFLIAFAVVFSQIHPGRFHAGTSTARPAQAKARRARRRGAGRAGYGWVHGEPVQAAPNSWQLPQLSHHCQPALPPVTGATFPLLNLPQETDGAIPAQLRYSHGMELQGSALPLRCVSDQSAKKPRLGQKPIEMAGKGVS